MPYTTLQDDAFNREITLRDAYRVMERFVADYLSRGDTPVMDFLHSYASMVSTGQTTDPAALNDFLAAAKAALDR